LWTDLTLQLFSGEKNFTDRQNGRACRETNSAVDAKAHCGSNAVAHRQIQVFLVESQAVEFQRSIIAGIKGITVIPVSEMTIRLPA